MIILFLTGCYSQVLRLDTEKNKVWLTHKKSLVRGNKYPVISQYSQLERNMELEGVIVAVKEKVVIVSFFGDVKVGEDLYKGSKDCVWINALDLTAYIQQALNFFKIFFFFAF